MVWRISTNSLSLAPNSAMVALFAAFMFLTSKKDAESSLFFDKHFTETSEKEGEEEILNVLRKLKRRSRSS